VVDERIEDVSFEGTGCAISKASASMMTLAVKGKTRAQAEELFQKFHEMLAGSSRQKFDAKQLGKLAVFSGVSEFPVRVKCATLAWHTLRVGLESQTKQTVTTE
jgi:nitrogen fixation NifU-like protein